MVQSVAAGGALLAFGVLILGIVGNNVRKYASIDRRYPDRSPGELTDGVDGAVRGTIADRSPTVRSPFGQVESVVAFWAVERYVRRGSRSKSRWVRKLDWSERVAAFQLDIDGRTVTVETTDDVEPLGNLFGLPNVPYDDVTLEAARGESPPEHVERFLAEFQSRYEDGAVEGDHAARVGETVERLNDPDQRLRYSERRFEPGQEVVVYGTGQSPTDADGPPALRADYLAAASDPSAIRTKLLKNSGIALAASLIPLAGGFVLLTGVAP